MAKLVSTDQRIVTGVTYPKSVYSRVLCVHCIVPAGMGESVVDVTPVVGNNVYLLGVDLWAYRRAVADWVGGFIWVRSGSEANPSVSEVVSQWQQIIDMSAVGKQAIYWNGEDQHWGFRFCRLYGEAERRFAVAVQNGYAVAWDLFAAFTISEG